MKQNETKNLKEMKFIKVVEKPSYALELGKGRFVAYDDDDDDDLPETDPVLDYRNEEVAPCPECGHLNYEGDNSDSEALIDTDTMEWECECCETHFICFTDNSKCDYCGHLISNSYTVGSCFCCEHHKNLDEDSNYCDCDSDSDCDCDYVNDGDPHFLYR